MTDPFLITGPATFPPDLGLEPGQRAGLIHYVLPRCPKDARFVACVGVVSGFANRVRLFSVFEK